MNKPSKLWGGLTGRQVALILGIPETKVNQSAGAAMDRAAVIAMKNGPAFFRMLADRMSDPTPGMLHILRRRKLLLERMEMPAL